MNYRDFMFTVNLPNLNTFQVESYTLTPVSLVQGAATVGSYLSFFVIGITLIRYFHRYFFYRQLRKTS